MSKNTNIEFQNIGEQEVRYEVWRCTVQFYAKQSTWNLTTRGEKTKEEALEQAKNLLLEIKKKYRKPLIHQVELMHEVYSATVIKDFVLPSGFSSLNYKN